MRCEEYADGAVIVIYYIYISVCIGGCSDSTCYVTLSSVLCVHSNNALLINHHSLFSICVSNTTIHDVIDATLHSQIWI